MIGLEVNNYTQFKKTKQIDDLRDKLSQTSMPSDAT